jgi:hypothetical protein
MTGTFGTIESIIELGVDIDATYYDGKKCSVESS